MADDVLLTEPEAARESKCSLRHFQNLRKAGKGPAVVRLGRRLMVRRAALLAWWHASEQAPRRAA
jgi:hypothetical protein